MSFLNRDPRTATENDIREFLKNYRHRLPTYANTIKALRIFFRDFLKMPIAQGFRIPKLPQKINHVPTKEELRRFYEALECDRDRAAFLMLATSGLRRDELLELTLDDIDLEKRMIIAKEHIGRTKQTGITFFNEEAAAALEKYLNGRERNHQRIFRMHGIINRVFVKTSERTGVDLSPQKLRVWFCVEMAKLGVPDRYVDAFCGRVPRSIIARHYSDYSPAVLKEIYDRAGLKVLG